VPALEPRSFSFNSVYGACRDCHGLGSRAEIDPAKIVVDPQLSITQQDPFPLDTNISKLPARRDEVDGQTGGHLAG